MATYVCGPGLKRLRTPDTDRILTNEVWKWKVFNEETNIYKYGFNDK
jgi:hypothetical protein